MGRYYENIDEIYQLELISKDCKNDDEAYFNGPEIITVREIIEKLKSFGYNLTKKPPYSEKEFAVNNILFITFMNDSKSEWLRYILIDGCYSAYDKNLEFCYNFIKDINNNIFKIKILDINDKEIKTDLNSFEDFKIKVKKHYEEDYNLFVQKFGSHDELVMCDKDFYDMFYAKYKKALKEKQKQEKKLKK